MHIVDPGPARRAAHDAALADVARRMAAAVDDDERRALKAERKALRKAHRAEVRFGRHIPW